MVNRILAALAVATLSACGGGGGGADSAVASTSAAMNTPASPSPTGSSASASASSSAAASTAQAAALVASASEPVNTSTAGPQSLRAADPLASGGYALAWRSQESASSAALFVRRYDAQGAPASGETRLAYATGAQEEPALAVLRDGSTVVVSVQAGSNWTVTARRFDANGAATGTTTLIASIPQDAAGASVHHSLAQPVVTALAGGGFVAGWASVTEDSTGALFAQHAQRFDAQGGAVGTPTDFAAAGVDRNLSLRLVATPGGDYVAGTTHRFNGIGYWQFRIGGNDVGALFDANAGLPELNTTLLPLADGRFALWSFDSSGGYMQIIDASGRMLGAATRIAVVPETAALLADGGWATVTRQMPGQPYLAQRFGPGGQAVGGTIELTTGVSRPLDVATTAGGFALAWTAADTQGDTDVKTLRVTAP